MSKLVIGVPKEVHENERRVAATPASVTKLLKLGFEVTIEKDAGTAANYPNADYVAAGATLVDDVAALWSGADVILKVRAPEHHPGLDKHELDLAKEGACLVSFLWPAQNEELVQLLADRKISSFAMDAVPRTTRAQKMDALSSMANIAGYRAVLEAAFRFGSFFTGQITAAGKVPPAKVLVIGAGVAGLAAIGAARGLGAMVRAFDTREAVREQVQSMGAEFLDLDYEESGEGKGGYAKVMSKEFIEAEMALFREQAKEVDIVITTALIPGKPAPRLWTQDMVELMKPGSVVVDLAAEQGGNCDVSVHKEVIVHEGVTVIGYSDLPSRLATTSSQLFSTNLTHLLDDMVNDEKGFHINLEDEIVRGCIVTHAGETMWPPPPLAKKTPPKPAPVVDPEPEAVAEKPAAGSADPGVSFGTLVKWVLALGLAGLWVALKVTADPLDVSHHAQAFVQHLTVFVLAVFVGWQVIWNVSPALHTPLMSVTNAISGIIIVGGLLQDKDPAALATILGSVAIFFATINIVGGFWVTQRMLKMFRK